MKQGLNLKIFIFHKNNIKSIVYVKAILYICPIIKTNRNYEKLR